MKDSAKGPKRSAPPVNADEIMAVDGHEVTGERRAVRNNKDKLRQNQAALGVNEEHKTKAMQKHKRGTFP